MADGKGLHPETNVVQQNFMETMVSSTWADLKHCKGPATGLSRYPQSCISLLEKYYDSPVLELPPNSMEHCSRKSGESIANSTGPKGCGEKPHQEVMTFLSPLTLFLRRNVLFA